MAKAKAVEVAAIEGDEAVFDIDTVSNVAIDSRRLARDFREQAETPHPLEWAPVHSKIVVVRQEGASKPIAVLATPDGHRTLAKDDPASKLPEGAVIRKLADGQFESVQLSPAITYPNLLTDSVADAIAKFVPYFHRAT